MQYRPRWRSRPASSPSSACPYSVGCWYRWPPSRAGFADKIGGLVWAAIWMWPLLGPASAVLRGKVPVLAGAGLAAFVALYLTLVLAGFGDRGRGPTRRMVLGLVVLAALGIALTA